MRKRIIGSAGEGTPPAGEDWLNLEDLAEVEVTSEDPAHPVESALLPGGTSGWRAAGPGEQTIRLLFAEPLALRRIWLEFAEPALSAPRSSCCAGPQIADGLSTRSCASNGTSAPKVPPAD